MFRDNLALYKAYTQGQHDGLTSQLQDINTRLAPINTHAEYQETREMHIQRDELQQRLGWVERLERLSEGEQARMLVVLKDVALIDEE